MGASAVAIASLWSAAVTYVVMTVAARVLEPAQATLLLTVLAVLFAAYGVLSGLALEVTRSIAASVHQARDDGPRLWVVAAVTSLVTCGVVVALVPIWRSRILHDADAGLLVALSVAVTGYVWHCVLVGAATGRARWGDAASVIGAEATVRLLSTVAVVLGAASITSMGVATAAGAFAWLVLLVVSPGVRSALSLRTDCAWPALARRISAALVAQGASAVLVVGFPVLLAATTAPADYRSAAPLLLAVSLTRAPVLLPLNALQGVVVSHLVRASTGLARPLVRMLGAVALVGLVGAALAYLVGPALLGVLFGADYVVTGGVLAVLTFAAAGTAALTLTGACAQALALHAVYLAGWVVAVVACLLLLQAPGSLELRTCLSLGLAPLAGLLVHGVGLARVRRRRAALDGSARA